MKNYLRLDTSALRQCSFTVLAVEGRVGFQNEDAHLQVWLSTESIKGVGRHNGDDKNNSYLYRILSMCQGCAQHFDATFNLIQLLKQLHKVGTIINSILEKGRHRVNEVR